MASNAPQVPFEPHSSSHRPFMLVTHWQSVIATAFLFFFFCLFVFSALPSREAHTCYYRHRQHFVILFVSIFVEFCTSFTEGSWVFSISDILNYFKQLCCCNSFLQLWHIKQGMQFRLDCSHRNKALTDSTVWELCQWTLILKVTSQTFLQDSQMREEGAVPLQLLTVFCWTWVKVSACAFKYKSLSLVRGL